ncbi:MAG TPA: glycoside hydrolase family 2 TIM barrel-domain containing protein [Sphingomonadaceae bacterium]|nr:glycoside hydrolase family 2 TIM barrel-domain containing protein [Sphingomonadaceae bacterium]
MVRGLLAAALAVACAPAHAQLLPEGPVLAAADLRAGQDLDGTWTWSIDPYRDGKAGFHGGAAGTGHRRYDDTDVEAASLADPLALYEYDLDRSATVELPSSWLTHAPEMRHYQGLVWYQKRFDAAPGEGKRQFLRFGAANYSAEVWLNGEFVGTHEGGFTPFTFEVTGRLRSTGNRLVVGVDSQRSEASVPPPVTDWETYGGLTRPVRLIELPATFVDDVHARLTDAGDIEVTIVLDGADAANVAVVVSLPELGERHQVLTDARGEASVLIPRPAELQRWSPDNPRLYVLRVAAGSDSFVDKVGFRTIATRGSQILLNGEPIFLRGISIHEEEIGVNPTRNITPEAARALLAEVKDGLNGNFVRLAHYPHGDAMVRAADEMGLIVWSEIPVYWRIAWDNPESLATARLMLAENIMRDRNRASIALWSVANETPVSEARGIFLNRLIADARALDPDRLVTAALLTERDESEGHPVMLMADPLAASVDVLAINTYNGWYGPDHPDELAAIEWRLAGDKPLILSELGAGALAGRRQEERPGKFSEDYQADYYRATLAMADAIPSLAGMSPWILKDFRSPRRQRPEIQDGWNRKGLISETGARKLAFHVLAGWYQSKAEVAAKSE